MIENTTNEYPVPDPVFVRCQYCLRLVPSDDGWFTAPLGGVGEELHFSVKPCTSCMQLRTRHLEMTQIIEEQHEPISSCGAMEPEASPHMGIKLSGDMPSPLSFDEYMQLVMEWARKEVESARIKRMQYAADSKTNAFAAMENTASRSGMSSLQVWHSWVARHIEPIEEIIRQTQGLPGPHWGHLFERAKDLLGYAFMLVIYCQHCISQREKIATEKQSRVERNLL